MLDRSYLGQRHDECRRRRRNRKGDGSMNTATSRPIVRPSRHSSRRATRHGYTLLEMAISTGATTVLLSGLMSTIAVANRAWNPDLKPAMPTEPAN
ncbi:MAG: hypothetical protein ISQ06_09425 [Planctomycetaceae bacterium]|nr:hypothetical protein [Planctomycetaceae bacterium]